MFVKSRKYYFDRSHLPKGPGSEDVWNIQARPKMNGGLDTAPYPDELVERCINLACPPDGTVLDPFVGSGTTLRVAMAQGRSGIGIELSPTFCDYIRKSLSPHTTT